MTITTIQNEGDYASPPQQLQDKILNRANELFVLPAVAIEAMEMTKDRDCSMAEFACLVERDPKLATDILSFSNSAIFSLLTPVTSLHQALVRLGLRQCRNLIMSVCAKGLMKSITLEQEWIREVLWQHSFTTATACLHLNRAFSLGFQGEEFTAGLLHDFGRTLIAVAMEEEFQKADPLDFVELPGFLEEENQVAGTDHCKFGGWYARELGLPDSLCQVIEWHHQPERENNHQKLIALVAAGDHIANHIQRFDEAHGYCPEDNAAVATLGTLFRRNIVDNFIEIAPHLVTEVQEMASTEASNSNGGLE